MNLRGKVVSLMTTVVDHGRTPDNSKASPLDFRNQRLPDDRDSFSRTARFGGLKADRKLVVAQFDEGTDSKKHVENHAKKQCNSAVGKTK